MSMHLFLGLPLQVGADKYNNLVQNHFMQELNQNASFPTEDKYEILMIGCCFF